MEQLLYTRDEAAKLLRISVSQLDNEARRGKIQRVKFGDGPRARVTYRGEDLEGYINEHLRG